MTLCVCVGGGGVSLSRIQYGSLLLPGALLGKLTISNSGGWRKWAGVHLPLS